MYFYSLGDSANGWPIVKFGEQDIVQGAEVDLWA